MYTLNEFNLSTLGVKPNSAQCIALRKLFDTKPDGLSSWYVTRRGPCIMTFEFSDTDDSLKMDALEKKEYFTAVLKKMVETVPAT